MPATKEQLHRLVDILPEEHWQTVAHYLERFIRARGIRSEEAVGTPAITHGTPPAPGSGEEWVDDDDTAGLSHLSIPALARDWDSEDDRVYDDEPPR